MLTALTSLADLGWYPYWDMDGRYPVDPSDEIVLVPSSTIKIYWIARPVQEEDGKWYANSFYMYEPFPSLIGGLYTSTKIKTDTYLFSGEISTDSIIGKVEEVSFWNRGMEDAEIVAYHSTITEMIGGSGTSKYPSIADAEDDGLKYFYDFGITNLLVRNFNQDSTNVIRSGDFEVSSGERGNSSIVTQGDTLVLEGMNFDFNFTLNFRFYLNEMTDFTLMKNGQALEIIFDENNRVINVEYFPYIGNSYQFSIEVLNLTVHEWIDFAIVSNNGLLTFVMNGVVLERNRVKEQIGGVDKIALCMDNLDGVGVIAHDGMGLADISLYSNSPFSPTGDNETLEMFSKMSTDTPPEIRGGTNFMDLLIDKNNNKIGGSSFASGKFSDKVYYTETDTIRKRGELLFRIWGATTSIYSTREYQFYQAKIEEIGDGDDVSFHIYKDTRARYSSGIGRFQNLSVVRNHVVAGTPLTLEIKVSASVVIDKPVFPMLSIFPGTRIKVKKTELVDHTYSFDEKHSALTYFGSVFPGIVPTEGKHDVFHDAYTSFITSSFGTSFIPSDLALVSRIDGTADLPSSFNTSATTNISSTPTITIEHMTTYPRWSLS